MVAELVDGSAVDLAPGEGQRALYALASLAVTALAGQVPVRAVRSADGTVLWTRPKDG